MYITKLCILHSCVYYIVYYIPVYITKLLRMSFLQMHPGNYFCPSQNLSPQNPQVPYDKHVTGRTGDGGVPPFPFLKKCYQLSHRFSKAFATLKNQVKLNRTPSFVIRHIKLFKSIRTLSKFFNFFFSEQLLSKTWATA